MIDVMAIIKEEMERLEWQVQQATALYNQAMTGLETLKNLTDKMREAAENERHNKPSGEETEIASGN